MSSESQKQPEFRRTVDGAIDYQYYIDKGRRLRSDAFFENGIATVRLARRAWRGITRLGA